MSNKEHENSQPKSKEPISEKNDLVIDEPKSNKKETVNQKGTERGKEQEGASATKGDLPITQPKAASVPAKKPAATPRPRPVAKAEEKPLEPSHKQPWLEQFTSKIEGILGKGVIEDSYINRPNDHLPTLVVNRDHWHKLAKTLRLHDDFAYDYMQSYSSVDYETHLEVVLHLFSFTHKERLAIRIKVDREESKLDSVSDIWLAANWNEREVYDLMGIHFLGHPDLRRILLPDQWVGYPLRKDYVPYDEGV